MKLTKVLKLTKKKTFEKNDIKNYKAFNEYLACNSGGRGESEKEYK